MSGQGGFFDRLTPEQQARIRQREARADQIIVVNEKGELVETLTVNGQNGPAASYRDLKGIYTYELSFPLSDQDMFKYGIGSDPGQPLHICVEWGLSEEQRKEMMESIGGPPEGGRGGGMGGGGRGGRGGGGRGGMGKGRGGMDSMRPQMPGQTKIWVKTELASPGNDTDSI